MARARSVPASACWWNSCRPTPPARCTSATAARQPTGRPLPTSCGRWAFAPSVSTTSTMPAGRWTSWQSAPGCDTWRPGARCCRFRRTAIAVTTCARWRSAPQGRCRGDLRRPAASVPRSRWRIAPAATRRRISMP
jgi:hypothetical protein